LEVRARAFSVPERGGGEWRGLVNGPDEDTREGERDRVSIA
jgi:hypothetical protein